MRTKEYNAYICKSNEILQKLNSSNIEELILNNLQNQGIIEDDNINILVKIIKNVVFDYHMFGREATINIIKNNGDYLFYTLINKGKYSIEHLKDITNSILEKNQISQSFDEFVLSSADDVNNSINMQNQKNAKKYVYASGK